MVGFGCTLIFLLPLVGSTKEFYAVNSLPSTNFTCYRNNETFQPCSTLDILVGQLHSQKISRIYLLDRKLQISRNVHLNFSFLYKVTIKPWRNNSLSTLVCNSDFSITFSGAKEVTVQSIQFKECGKSNPLILIDTSGLSVKLLQIINVTFTRSNQSSLKIVSDIHELQVINSTFTGGAKGVNIEITGTVLKTILRSTTFSHNTVGSFKMHESLNESSLYIQNCTFSNNNVSDFSIYLFSINSIVIQSSSFEDNFANNFIQIESVINMSIVDTCFHSNVVQKGSVLQLTGHPSIASLLSFDSNIFTNHTAKVSDGGLLSVNCLQTFFRNCVFQGNVVTGSGSTLTISESSLTVVNMTVFEENVASLGGAVKGKSIQKLYVDGCNFTKNIAECGGALIFTGEAIFIQNSVFNDNEAKEHGGALQIHGQIVSITGSHYYKNYASFGDAGAINITVNGNLHITSSKFTFNEARSGGALSINKGYQGHILFNNTSFERNRATRGNGGAISTTLAELEEIVFSDFKFDNSDAVKFTLGFSTFYKNSAYSGGAISSTGIVIVIESSNFSRNHALIDGGATLLNSKFVVLKKCIFRDNLAGKFLESLGNGGALKTSGTILFISQSFFYTNKAGSGGALLILTNNLTRIYSSNFIHNQAFIYGGAIGIDSGIILEIHSCNFDTNEAQAIIVYSLVTFATLATNFTSNLNNAISIQKARIMILRNCLFYNNTSYDLGGTVWVVKQNTELIFIANCVFRNNTAAKGGAIVFDANEEYFSTNPSSCSNFFDKADAIIDEINTVLQQKHINNISLLVYNWDSFNLTIISNCTFAYNNATHLRSYGGAILVRGRHSDEVSIIKNSVYDQLVFMNCTFVGNSALIGGGIFCYSCKVFVKNTLFHDNTAKINGGGVSLKLSEICFSGNVSFIANKVISKQGKGGALYSDDRREDCEKDLCPVLWTSQSTLSFVDNIANKGPAVFGGMLNQCNRLPEESLEASLKRLEFDSMPYSWDSYAITSSGVKFCYADSCKIHKVNRSISPGQSFTVNVACLDQMGLPLNNCIVKSDGYETAKFQLGRGETTKRTINGFEQLSFHLYSNILNSTSLIIYSEVLCSKSMWNKIEVLLDVRPCPMGYYLEKMKCICDYRLKTIFKSIECNITNELIFTSSGWFSYEGNSLRMNSKCPLNYCQYQRTFVSPLQPDDQCAYNCGGVLCGRCLANYSVVLGSWKCMECSHTSSYNFIWLTVVMALAGVILVVFLLLVKMTVSSGTINGLIFYSNILSFSGMLNHQNCAIHPFLHVFISWINLDSGIEVCFYSGMDVYQKTWLQFVYPFYILLLVGVIILVCHYSSKVMKLMGVRNIEVLATLFLLSYAKLLKTIVTALSVTNIMVASADNITDPLRPHKVWVYDGNIDYFSSKHLPLFIVAVLLLFTLFVPYTLFLLCGQWLHYLPRKRGFRWIHSTVISTIMDAYHAPYTKHHRYWTGLGLLIRCCLFTIFGTSYSTGINLMSISIAVILLLVIRIASSGKLYRNKVVGLLELFYLSNLGILATVLLINDTFCVAITVSTSLSLIGFVGVLLYHLHHETKKSNFYKFIKRRFNILVIAIETKCAISEKEEKNVISEQENTTTYFELRESLIDSS